MSIAERVAARALEIAAYRVGVRERGGKNRGPEVDRWVKGVGLDPTGSHSWCVAFVYSCVQAACEELEMLNPLPRTGGVQKLWERTNLALKSRSQFGPGCIFLMDKGHGKGHVGFIERVADDGLSFTSIEGNTNPGGSRDGDGVYRRARGLDEITIGFINVGLADGGTNVT